MLPSQQSPAPAGREGAELSCSRLAHPAPLPAGSGCGYTGVCPSIPILPAPCRASIPQGKAWSQPGQALPCFCWVLLRNKGVWQPYTLPSGCHAGSTRCPGLCKQHFPVPSWVPAQRGPAVPSSPGHLQEGNRSSQNGPAQPLRLLLRQLPSFSPKLIPAVATSTAVVVANLSKHLQTRRARSTSGPAGR